MKLENIPDFAKPYKKKGYDVRLVGGTYQLFRVSSKKVEGKNYPVLIQEMIGVIKEDGTLVPKKKRQGAGFRLEYGLSRFLFFTFRSDMKRSMFNGRSEADKMIALAVIRFIYGDIRPETLKLTYLTHMVSGTEELAAKVSESKIVKYSERLGKLLTSTIKDESERSYLCASLRQVTIPEGVDCHDDIYTDDVRAILTRNGVIHEQRQ